MGLQSSYEAITIPSTLTMLVSLFDLVQRSLRLHLSRTGKGMCACVCWGGGGAGKMKRKIGKRGSVALFQRISHWKMQPERRSRVLLEIPTNVSSQLHKIKIKEVSHLPFTFQISEESNEVSFFFFFL